MTAVFADSFYFIALLNPSDSAHAVAVATARSLNSTIVTTTWVLIEVADALSAPLNRRRAARFLFNLEFDPGVEVIPADAAFYNCGLDLYERRPDKG